MRGDTQSITDAVTCVPLPLPLPDLQVVNAYVIGSPSGVTLVDPGWAYPPSEEALTRALHALGYGVSDVVRIVATHQHWDHYSLGVGWRDRYGMELMLGREERHSIDAFHRQPDVVHPVQVGLLREAGAPALATAIDALQWEPYERDVPFGTPDRWLDDGDVIDCGTAQLVVRATPGHTRGHILFEDCAGAQMFTGDHLLPRITPSIAFERAPGRLPLRSYIDSLRLVLRLPDARMLPAHGSTARTTHARAQELVEHHQTRLLAVGDLAAAGSETAFEVASKMRWTRRERRLDELDVVNRMTAVLEVQSHLDLLAAQGRLAVVVEDGVRHFSTV
ncbi:MBL fold metallo-hydrolase [Mycolicibacterium sp. J2]|jgi:glyoxylase-like metal-dependent hydrolase (beta-lactamase superfamily II)|uniref:MBL fold metallo-hydrolase n=1 Tax=Mycolicibacterium sp. J2 TaxID=2993511 RepID=UPI00224A6C11|nr:MBL fold metallo-hydrolase [Mycolicibacterium sp. J2]MCX2715430.1 MBL fold metallo-hydrolase [Mycolicibacterium sp. J2]